MGKSKKAGKHNTMANAHSDSLDYNDKENSNGNKRVRAVAHIFFLIVNRIIR